jgi:hypothetical protein
MVKYTLTKYLFVAEEDSLEEFKGTYSESSLEPPYFLIGRGDERLSWLLLRSSFSFR